MYPIKPLYSAPDNRKTRRTVLTERDYLLGVIWDYEYNFGADLFNPSLGWSYEQIYLAYLEGWDKLLERLNKKKIKYFKIDEGYFEKLYKPIEK